MDIPGHVLSPLLLRPLLGRVASCPAGSSLPFITSLAFPFPDADAGQVPDGRRPEGPQAKDHPLSAR